MSRLIKTKEFARRCQSLRLNRTNGKSVQEVCRELVCSGAIEPIISFFSNDATRAIAYEDNGKLYINTAKKTSGAGGPGNIAHEVTHILGYRHFTNWAFSGKNSVPYQIGSLAEELIDESPPEI